MRLENCFVYDNVIRTYNQMRLLSMKKMESQTHLLVFLLILVYAHFIT